MVKLIILEISQTVPGNSDPVHNYNAYAQIYICMCTLYGRVGRYRAWIRESGNLPRDWRKSFGESHYHMVIIVISLSFTPIAVKLSLKYNIKSPLPADSSPDTYRDKGHPTPLVLINKLLIRSSCKNYIIQ